jgi:ribosomal protein L3 glutamine methyltransferase
MIMFNLTSLKTLRDVYRFAVSKANDASLFYGHGTDNVFDDMLSLVMGSLKLPFEKYD